MITQENKDLQQLQSKGHNGVSDLKIAMKNKKIRKHSTYHRLYYSGQAHPLYTQTNLLPSYDLLIHAISKDQNARWLDLRLPESLFLDFVRLLFFLRRLDGPGRSDDVSTTVSCKGRFLDEDSSTLDSGEGFFFCLGFEKISSISDMVARKLHCVTSDVTTVRMVLFFVD